MLAAEKFMQEKYTIYDNVARRVDKMYLNMSYLMLLVIKFCLPFTENTLHIFWDTTLLLRTYHNVVTMCFFLSNCC